MKAFISTNAWLPLDNEDFQEFVNFQRPESLKAPSYEEFHHKLLPKVGETLHREIENRLNNAESISIVVNMWNNKMEKDFIAVGAYLMNSSFEDGEIMIIGMKRMKANHTEDYIKNCIETMVNKYDFKKSKIKCKNFLFCFLFRKN